MSIPDNSEWWLCSHEDGKWIYKNFAGNKVDWEKFEIWKTKYYELEGWDTPKQGGLPERLWKESG
jgi:aldehyde:ferredoxin oxidoreductase